MSCFDRVASRFDIGERILSHLGNKRFALRWRGLIPQEFRNHLQAWGWCAARDRFVTAGGEWSRGNRRLIPDPQAGRLRFACRDAHSRPDLPVALTLARVPTGCQADLSKHAVRFADVDERAAVERVRSAPSRESNYSCMRGIFGTLRAKGTCCASISAWTGFATCIASRRCSRYTTAYPGEVERFPVDRRFGASRR